MRDDLLQPLEPDPIIEVYKRDVDRTLLEANLRLSPIDRLRKLAAYCRFLERVRGVAIAKPGSSAQDAGP